MNAKASFTLELAQRFDGYLVQLDETIVQLREADLITTIYAGDGYVIAKAVPVSRPRPQVIFPREAKRSARA